MNADSPAKPATLHDVAKAAGVSLITASRALSNPGIVSDKTIAKVQAAAEATGYIPNLLAGGLKSKRSLMVAGIVPSLSVLQFLPTVQTLTNELAAAGYQLILGQTQYDPAVEESVLNTMIGRQPDGIVITGLVRSQRARDRLRRSGIPVVETWDLTDQPIDMLVGFSHRKVGEAVGAYFMGKKWQHIGVASGDDLRARMRREGFLAALGREVPTALVPAPSSLERGRLALVELLASDPKLEAVCCSSDQLAHGVMVEAMARGMRVPGDLAVCGFGNADFGAHMLPSISTVHVDGPEIGRLAARLIVDRCRQAPISKRVIDVGFRMIERQSTAGIGTSSGRT
ncbi:LacI family DNA-binding transcriptional regulator [Variovorax sp. N23]|uniref:LacI family DNA-binding transcriptional regulator n=1 Tax=Variovorax sp. N23 TaxID=2980555 RepID=UPI0021CA9628|nr:LacI family DNA-binding transcriptional regulator [Variovorax sp. N23]MCU4118966.1 LacI family DNA-binding transcriptional regulator [Variovorax sp. N23]